MRIAWGQLLLMSTVLTLTVTSVAWAHAELSPSQVPAGSSQEFTLEVRQEKDVPTTEVRLEVPDGFAVTDVPETPGWQASHEGSALIWYGGEIAPDQDAAQFTFEGRAPEETGEFAWGVLQTYEDGEVVEWTGPEGSEEPAAVVEVTAADSQNTARPDADTHEQGEANETHAETTAPSRPLPSSGGFVHPISFFGGLAGGTLALLTLGVALVALLLRR